MRIRYLLAIVALSSLSSCDEQPPHPVAPKAVLFVTWLVPGQPPATTQTVMGSYLACHSAEQAALMAGQNAKTERAQMNAQDNAEAQADIQAAINKYGALSGISPEDTRKLKGEPLPQVSAFCVNQE